MEAETAAAAVDAVAAADIAAAAAVPMHIIWTAIRQLRNIDPVRCLRLQAGQHMRHKLNVRKGAENWKFIRFHALYGSSSHYHLCSGIGDLPGSKIYPEKAGRSKR